MVVDLVIGAGLPVLPFRHQDARPMRFEAGASANVMIAAARLGLRVSAIGALGDDLGGGSLSEIWRNEGVDPSCVQVTPGAQSPLTLALIDHQRKEHVFIGNVGEGRPADYTEGIAAGIAEAGALFWHGYTLHEKQIVPLIEPPLRLSGPTKIHHFFDGRPREN